MLMVACRSSSLLSSLLSLSPIPPTCLFATPLPCSLVVALPPCIPPPLSSSATSISFCPSASSSLDWLGLTSHASHVRLPVGAVENAAKPAVSLPPPKMVRVSHPDAPFHLVQKGHILEIPARLEYIEKLHEEHLLESLPTSMNVCHTEELQTRYIDQLIARSNSWRPKLITIEESRSADEYAVASSSFSGNFNSQ